MSALLSPEEAAKRVRVCERTLRDLRKRGLIRYVAVTDRKIFYRPEDCDEYLASRLRLDTPCETRPRGKRAGRAGVKTGNIIPFSQRRKTA
jgi:hypothetical protein